MNQQLARRTVSSAVGQPHAAIDPKSFCWQNERYSLPVLTALIRNNNKTFQSHLGRARRSRTTMQQVTMWCPNSLTEQPIPVDDNHSHLIHPSLDRPHSPSQTASGDRQTKITLSRHKYQQPACGAGVVWASHNIDNMSNQLIHSFHTFSTKFNKK